MNDLWRAGGFGLLFKDPDYRSYRASARSVSNLAAWAPAHAPIDNGSESALLMLVSCNFFSLYGLEQATAGQLFRDEECSVPGSAPVAVVSEELWRGRFGSDPQILGTTIKLWRRCCVETPLAVSTLDPLVYLAVSVILLGSAAAAMLGPAWYATRADPVVALGHT